MDNEHNTPAVSVQGFTYQDRRDLLPVLNNSIDVAGGWILDRRAVSAGALELQIETQRRALPEVYCALLGSGIELTRGSHRVLAEQCNCGQHLRGRRGYSDVLALSVSVQFLLESPGDLDPMLRLATQIGAA